MFRLRIAIKILLLMFLVFGAVSRAAAGQASSDLADDTMLMFVGEAQPVVTVASRTPEAPTTAPAIVTVIGREEMDQRGYQTLAELLADQPGFFIAAGGRGSVPYLRGLRDSVLFLYDGVPMTTGVTKSLAPLDQEISLFAVERVEIVRGPGSILWGPDAFAGVVNIVPARGREMPGVNVGAKAGGHDLFGTQLGVGRSHDKWEGFLGGSAVRNKFYDLDYLAWDEDQIISQEVERSKYSELVGTLSYDNWLNFSGRWSDFSRRYTMRNADETTLWDGKKETPVNQLKVSASKIIGPSHYTLTGYYQETDYQIKDADVERSQQNRVLHAEMLWDRRVFSRGMLTLGGSYRYNAVDGALVRDGFLPEFLLPDEPIFVPRLTQDDFTNRLSSAFGQFRYRWGASEWWLGARYDDHSQYKRTISHSLGFYRPIGKNLHVKLSYGTAHRSPYSSQLFDAIDFEPESIRTASGQLTWQPGDHQLEVSLFHSRLYDHRAEDPYGGLSQPASRELYGLELAGRISLTETLKLNGNLSLINASEDDDTWQDEICFVRADGSTTCSVLDQWTQPAEQGPGWLANMGLLWLIGQDHTFNLSARFGGHYDDGYQKGLVEDSYSQPLLVDLNYRRPGFFSGHDNLVLRITNLFDKDYRQSDVYGPVNGPPLQVTVQWQLAY